ncbi:uncharacterized protein LOC100205670 isoform X2 [Hydra vulgaris]|uniref:Uncharacterized protein LOC100205670 isoform X2 n=1 Tax=Hydra vulgaris TaxID=6087 RepID=A0ABM4D448_HYDVU
MPVLYSRKRLTQDELKHMKPYILELRKREQEKNVSILQQIKQEDDAMKTECQELEELEKQINEQERLLYDVKKKIEESEVHLFVLRNKKCEIFSNIRETLTKSEKPLDDITEIH